MPNFGNIPTSGNSANLPSSGRNIPTATNSGNVPTAESLPPGAPVFWIDGQSLDGAGNASLTNNQNLTSIVNRGSRGGTLTPPSTAPKFKLTGGFGSILFAGADTLQSPAGAALSQPNTVVLVVKRTAAAGVNVFADGVTGGGRQQVYDNSGQLSLFAGGSVAHSSASTQNKYNVIVSTFNGASSLIRLNDPLHGDTVTGNAGANAPTGVTLGGEFAAANTMQGEIVQYLFYNGSTVTRQQIEDWLDQKYNVGWPKTTLTATHYSGIASTPKLTIASGEKVCFFGDSITHFNYFTGWVTSINAVANPDITTVEAGVGGDTWALLDARVIADVVNLAPQPATVIIECGVNDWSAATATPLGESLISGQSVITKLKAGISGVKIAIVSVLCCQEFYPDPAAPQADQINAAFSSLSASNGCTYIDVRAPQQAYEAANNTPPPGNQFATGPLGQTLLTSDGAHPNATGDALMCTAGFARTTVT